MRSLMIFFLAVVVSLALHGVERAVREVAVAIKGAK
jgi:hypothetical protein